MSLYPQEQPSLYNNEILNIASRPREFNLKSMKAREKCYQYCIKTLPKSLRTGFACFHLEPPSLSAESSGVNGLRGVTSAALPEKCSSLNI